MKVCGEILKHFDGNLLYFEALKSSENPAEVKQCPEKDIFIFAHLKHIQRKSMRILKHSQSLPLNCHTLI